MRRSNYGCVFLGRNDGEHLLIPQLRLETATAHVIGVLSRAYVLSDAPAYLSLEGLLAPCQNDSKIVMQRNAVVSVEQLRAAKSAGTLSETTVDTLLVEGYGGSDRRLL